MYLAFQLPIKGSISSPLPEGGFRFCAGARRTICELVIPDELQIYTKTNLLRDVRRQAEPQPGSLVLHRYADGRQVRIEIELGSEPEADALDILVFGATDTGFAPYLARVEGEQLVWEPHPAVRLFEAGASGAGEWAVVHATLRPADPPLVIRWGRDTVFVFHPTGKVEWLSTVALLARLSRE